MFRIQAGYKGEMEVGVSADEARRFFGEPRNFVEMMPGIESIEAQADGTRLWTILTEVPMVGAVRQVFPVRLTEDGDKLVEWSPANVEQGNLLRYAAHFTAVAENRTAVRIEQTIEIRRASAKELHTFAGWVGEERISKEMQRGVTAMMDSFMKRVRVKLNG